jgi:hypothetical protein
MVKRKFIAASDLSGAHGPPLLKKPVLPEKTFLTISYKICHKNKPFINSSIYKKHDSFAIEKTSKAIGIF